MKFINSEEIGIILMKIAILIMVVFIVFCIYGVIKESIQDYKLEKKVEHIQSNRVFTVEECIAFRQNPYNSTTLKFEWLDNGTYEKCENLGVELFSPKYKEIIRE